MLLFARPAREEARAKGLARARPLFELGRDRVLAAARTLDGVELIVVGDLGEAAPHGSVRRLSQRGASFAERLGHAFDDAAALGFESVVAVGIDSPSLRPRHLAAAFDALSVAPVVLGRCADGGVFVLGVRGSAGRLFDGVRWQTSYAFGDLARNASGALVLAEVLPDLDRPADLRALRYWTCDPEIARLLAEATSRPGRPYASHLPRPAARATARRDTPRGPPPAAALA